MITDRRLQFVCGLYLVLGAVAIVGALLEASAHGGYHPELYVGRLDPVRAALLVVLLPAPFVMAWFAAMAIARWRRRSGRAELAEVAMSVGFLIGTVAVVALIIWYPLASGPVAVPAPIIATMYVAIALTIPGFVPALATAIAAAIRRRDRSAIVGLIFIAVLILFLILRRS